MINFVLWKWRQKLTPNAYTANYVNAMVHMLSLRHSEPHRILCVTDDPRGIVCETFPLWDDCAHLRNASGQHLPSCYRRLKLFDRQTQQLLRIKEGDKIVSIDLDAILVRDVTPLFKRDERFVAWRVPGTRHEWVYNGSMFMFAAGDLDYVWHDFDPRQNHSPVKSLLAGYMGSDQGWLSYKLIKEPFAGGWTAEHDGVFSFVRNVEKGRMNRHKKMNPLNARIVFFAGRRKPWHADVLKEHPWINDCVAVRKELVA